VLILSNHVSYIDPIVVGAGCRRRVNFMAKSELFKIPIFGYIIKKLYAFPVRRGGFGKDAFKKALELLNNKEVLLIFPEGQRSKDGKLLSGKSGIGWIVAKAIKQNKHLKIIPARIIGSDKVLPVGSKFIRISPLEIRFGRSIKFEDLLEKFEEDPKRLYHLITERVMEKIKEL
jgi:1-acyl-sn-glycerol-3-phosphate acyltransferase